MIKENREFIDSKDRALALELLMAVKSIKYGHVQITLHDSKVVQIDKTEKIRLRRPRDCVC